MLRTLQRQLWQNSSQTTLVEAQGHVFIAHCRILWKHGPKLEKACSLKKSCHKCRRCGYSRPIYIFLRVSSTLSHFTSQHWTCSQSSLLHRHRRYWENYQGTFSALQLRKSEEEYLPRRRPVVSFTSRTCFRNHKYCRVCDQMNGIDLAHKWSLCLINF